MGYSVEVSFNTLKHNVQETQECITKTALENGCNSYYFDFEFENNLRYNRSHCVFTIVFQDEIDNIINFIQTIKPNKGIYIESVLDNDTNNILYASQLYISQMMDKDVAKLFRVKRRERSYSEEEKELLHILEKSKRSS